MDEHADADEEIVGLVLGYDAFGDAVGHGLGHGVLCRAEHLHGLLRALDRHLVEQDRGRLAEQVGATTASSDVNPSLLLVRAWAKPISCASTRAHDEVDVGRFTLTDERFTDAESVHLCHRHLLPRKREISPNADASGIRLNAILVVSIRLAWGRTG